MNVLTRDDSFVNECEVCIFTSLMICALKNCYCYYKCAVFTKYSFQVKSQTPTGSLDSGQCSPQDGPAWHLLAASRRITPLVNKRFFCSVLITHT